MSVQSETNSAPPADLVSAARLIESNGLPSSSFYRAIKDGEVAGYDRGRRIHVSEKEALEWWEKYKAIHPPRPKPVVTPTEPTATSKLVTVPEAAASIGRHQSNIYRAIREGRIVAHGKHGKSLLVMLADVSAAFAKAPHYPPRGAKSAPAAPTTPPPLRLFDSVPTPTPASSRLNEMISALTKELGSQAIDRLELWLDNGQWRYKVIRRVVQTHSV